MKKAEYSEIKNLDVKALIAKAKEINKDLTELKLKKDVKDIKSGFKKRKDLARVLTVLRQKQLIVNLGETK
jgi:large subunit ribosomal protein L29